MWKYERVILASTGEGYREDLWEYTSYIIKA